MAVICRRLVRKVTLVCIAMISISSCRQEPKPPDVILIVVDSMRADRLDATVMPQLADMAKSGFVFRNAIAQAPWTAPSMASILSGLAPSAHGVDLTDEGLAVFDDGIYSLAESFQQSGYLTGAVVTSPWMESKFGFDQGFEVYENLLGNGHAAAVMGAANLWLELTKGGQPRFLLVHFSDMHAPYQSPVELLEHFQSRYESRELSEEEFGRLGSHASGSYDDPQSRDLAGYQQAYSAAAEFVDIAIANLFKKVRAENAETVFILTSDHGEAFYEHGQPGHGSDLYDEQLRVPLIFLLPSFPAQARAIDTQVELVDIYPTIAQLLGLSIPQYPLSGQSLVDVLVQEGNWPSDQPVGAIRAKGASQIMARMPHLKVIQTTSETQQVQEVYDLLQDPGETDDIGGDAERHESAMEMLQRLEARYANSGPVGLQPSRVPVDPELLETLQAPIDAVPQP